MICKVCNNEFELTKQQKSAKRKGAQKTFYCSRACANSAKITQVDANCDFCGKRFSKRLSQVGKSSYCSRSCSAKRNNSKYPKREREIFVCACGKEMSRNASRCIECVRLSRKDSLKKSIASLGQKRLAELFSEHPVWPKSRVYRKVTAHARRKHEKPETCDNCDWKYSLVWHHIRPVSDFPDTATVGEVNDRKNLSCLCPNCHGYVHEFGKLPIS